MNFTYPKSLQSPEDSSRSSSPDLIFPDQFPSLDGSSRIGQSAHSRAHPTYSSSQYGHPTYGNDYPMIHAPYHGNTNQMPSHQRSSRQILQEASREELIRSGNCAYIQVCTELETIRTAFMRVTDMRNTQNLSEEVLHGRNIHSQGGRNASLPKPKAEDYPNIRFWYRADYTKWLNNEKKSTKVQKRRPGAIDSSVTDDEITVLDGAPASGSKPHGNEGLKYLEHSDGQSFLPADVSQLSRLARSVWHGLKQQGLAPQRWGHASSDVLTEFFAKVSRQLPDLALCDNNWKLQLYATQTYPSWAANHLRNSNAIKIKSEPKSEPDTETVVLPAVPVKTSGKRPRLQSINSSSAPTRTVEDTTLNVAQTTAESLLELASSPRVGSSPTPILAPNSGVNSSFDHDGISASTSTGVPDSEIQPPLKKRKGKQALKSVDPLQKYVTEADKLVSSANTAAVALSKQITALAEAKSNQDTVLASTGSTALTEANVDPAPLPAIPENTTRRTRGKKPAATGSKSQIPANSGGRKKLQVDNDAYDAKSLYAKDFIKTNPRITRSKFDSIWEKLDQETREHYEKKSVLVAQLKEELGKFSS